MIPRKYEALVFAFFMSSLMTLIMSGVVSYINVGLVDNFITIWKVAFLNSFVVAFPTVIFVVPIVKKAVHKLVRDE